VRSVLLLLALLASSASLQARAQEARRPTNGCVVCHGEQARQHERGLHQRAGIGCVDCHGGDSSALEAPEAHGSDLVALRGPSESVEACGSCHGDVPRMRLYGLRTDQLSLYATSQHGMKLAEDPQADVATCVSCHGSHEVLAHTDTRSPVHKFNQVETCGECHADAERMERHGLKHDVIDEYRNSIHGIALIEQEHPAAPACTDCHGSHGAAPPRVREIETVCGHCHSVVQDYFERGAHAPSRSVSGSVQCASCHRNHAVSAPSSEMFLGDEEGHCGSCHDAEVGTALAVAQRLHADVVEFEQSILRAEEEVRAASARGLFLGAESGYLGDARSLLVRARALTHTLSTEVLDDALNRGDAMVDTAMENLSMKRRGLRDRKIFTGIFFAVALAFCIALLLYAREIRGRWKDGPSDGSMEQADGI
jgi:hypothetical protein